MSRPQNVLNNFRSYSYHHILVACDGTESALALAEETQLTTFDHEQADRKFDAQTNSKGRYVVLINGMSDTQFSITSAKWSNVFIPTQNTPDKSTHFRTMAVDGQLDIKEPKGVNFLNQLNEVRKSLGTDANGIVFLLKTIFVGHRDDGYTETISNIRPLLFVMYDITALFDVEGAEYTMAFVGVSNGAARMQHVSSVGDGFAFDIKPNATLQQTFIDLSTALNNYYQSQKEKIRAEGICSGLPDDFLEQDFIDVTYKIKIDEAYRDMIAGTASLPNQQDRGEDDAVVKKGSSTSIEGLIDIIMNSSQEVLDENKERKDDSTVQHMYKITSSLNSSPRKFEVIYHVQHFTAATVTPEEFEDFQPPEDSGIAFDYIFSGKNIDIKSFDIKMQYGMTFFQTLAASSSMPRNTSDITGFNTSESTVAGTGNKQGPGDQQAQADLPNRKPLFLGMSLKDTHLRNRRYPGPAASYGALLMRHAVIENLEARMVIHGNPQMLEETTQLPLEFDPEFKEQFTPQTITVDGNAQDTEDAPRPVWPRPHTSPAYVKVNVYMPTDAITEFGTDPRQNPQDYASQFWYQGWYFCLGINNVFDGGEFTQELEMISQPVDDQQSQLSNTTEDCDQTPLTAASDSRPQSLIGQTTPAPAGAALEQTIKQKTDARSQTRKGRNGRNV